MAERTLRFLHPFCGPNDVVKEALEAEAKKEWIQIKVGSYDKLKLGDNGHDLADSPFWR